MKLTFPNTTETLVRMNPANWPDSVRALLNFHALRGDIRLIRNRWYRIRRETDEDIKTPRTPYGKTLPPETFPPCKQCGKPTHHPRHKYCSRDCSFSARKTKRGYCEQCGEENLRSDARFCSRSCVLKYRTKAKPPCLVCGTLVHGMANKFCSLACSNKAKEGRRFGTVGPL